MFFSKYRYYLHSIVQLMTGMRPRSRILRVFARVAPPGFHLVELPTQGVRLKTRGVMDIWSVKETFLDRFYDRFGVPVGDGWTVVDVGGGIGDFTILAAKAHPDNQVYAFEPTPDSFALLKENLSMNRVDNVHAFPEAVWSEVGTLAMDTTTGEPGQFISRGLNGAQAPDQVRVPSTTLAEIFQRLGIERCDLLKLDCEGAEYPILFSAPQGVLERVQRMVMEYHDNVSEHTHHDLERFLQEEGFRVRIQPNFVHDYLGYLYAERSPAE